VAAKKESHVLQQPKVLKNLECTLAQYSPNSEIVAAASDSTIFLWSAEMGQYLGALCDAELQVSESVFSFFSSWGGFSKK
jgi:hypothetical protein